MSQDRHNATNEEYCFESLPKNVRQVGETMQGTRFFHRRLCDDFFT